MTKDVARQIEESRYVIGCFLDDCPWGRTESTGKQESVLKEGSSKHQEEEETA